MSDMAPKDAPDIPAEAQQTIPEVESKPKDEVEETKNPASSSQQPADPQTTNIPNIAGLSITDPPAERALDPAIAKAYLDSTSENLFDELNAAITTLANDERNAARLQSAKRALTANFSGLTPGIDMLALACAISGIHPSWANTATAAASPPHLFGPSPAPPPGSSEYDAYKAGTEARTRTLHEILEGARNLEGKDFDDFLEYMVHILTECRGLVGKWNNYIRELERDGR